MKNFLFFLFIFFVYGCTSNNQAYWCGDHPCINEKEREAYFKKTMIIEVREIEKKDIKNNSQIDQITEQAVLDEKKRIKEEKNLLKRAKLEEKKRIKTEKQKAKKAKLEEKRKIKAERTKAREAKLKEKKRIKEEKELAKKIKIDEKKLSKKKVKENIKNIDDNFNKSSIFKELVERITKRNNERSYPDINNISN